MSFQATRNIPPYIIGTIAGNAGATTITGTSTGWVSTDNQGNTVGLVYPGDLLLVGSQPINPIKSVDSATAITLELPLTATVAAGTAYRILRYVPSPQGVILATLYAVQAQGTDAVPDVSRTFDGGSGRAKLRATTGGGFEFAIGASGAVDGALAAAWSVDLAGALHAKDVYANRGGGSGGVFFGGPTTAAALFYDGANYTFSGLSQNIVIGNSGNFYARDLYVNRAGGGSGAVFFGSSSTPAALFYDGLNYTFSGLVQNLVITNNGDLAARDLYALRRESAGGAVYFNLAKTAYLYFDGGSQYVLGPGVSNAGLSMTGPCAASSFPNSSDYRIKVNSEPLADGLQVIDRVKIYQGNFADNLDQTRHYVFAHELAEVLPNAVWGGKDAIDDEGKPKLQAVDYTRLVPLLVRAVQQLSETVRELQAAQAQPAA